MEDKLIQLYIQFKEFRWSQLKSRRLKRTRGVSFEEIIESKLIDILKHPHRENQQILICEHKGYLWAVPYVIEDNIIFLKTIYPSRKLMKIYKKERRHEKN
jgi:hypothetical protein